MEHPDLANYIKPLFLQALALCEDTQQAQDLTQEVMMQALYAYHRGKQVENLGAWLSTVLKRKWYRLLKQKYHKPSMLYGVSFDDADDAPTPEESALQAEELGSVRRELAHLALIYRQVAVMHYLENKNISEIAISLGIPRGTVLSRLDAGRKQIRRNVNMSQEYGKRSIQPESMSFGINGQVGDWHEPFDAVRSMLPQNILLAAYPDPQAPQKLSLELGVALPYLENEIEKLIGAQLMARLKDGKVRTDFVITDAASIGRMLQVVKQQASEAIHSIWPKIHSAAGDLSSIAGFQAMSNEDLVCFLLAETSFHNGRIVREIENLPAMLFPTNPLRPHGGRWIAHGMATGSEPDGIVREIWDYSISGRCVNENFDDRILLAADWDFMLGRTHSLYHFAWNYDQQRIARVLYSFHEGKQESLDEASLALLPRLQELRLLEHSGDGWRVRIPFISKQENDQLHNLAKHLAGDILISLPNLYRKLTEVAPKAPKGILEDQPPQFQGLNFIPMAVLRAAMTEKLLSLDPAVNHPVMYFVVR